MELLRRTVLLLACAAALAATLVVARAPVPDGAAAQESGGAVAQQPGDAAPARAPKRYRSAYVRWRQRLQRHDVFVGRNLLPEVRAADGGTVPPTASRLRTSIVRMQKRWAIWLRTTERGRAVAFRLKVRDRVPGWGRANLRSIARCESKNDPRAIGGGGTYRGLYQFSFSTWRVVGGYGDPAAASRWEQTWRAWLLLSRHGAGHWPVCG